ncbi:MAG: acetyl-CoA decarbonylase/synthase complex subunit gamma [Planctomycetes bacterium]|nr:acetyl-CoA decarbonylase/synthase complex subunit gamma [Planctomycetota bacterium]
MALTGLSIFKLLPKTNCKKCGMPTCLAFAMQLAQKRAKLDSCPFVSDEAKQALDAASAPPMRLIKFGSGDQAVQVGQESVLFRHEEKFHNPTVVASTVSDSLTGDALLERIKAVNDLQFERVGLHLGVTAMVIRNDSGSPKLFRDAASAVKQHSKLAVILCADSPDAIQGALEELADTVPLIAAATQKTIEAMAGLAKTHKCPLTVKADSLQALADLTEKAVALGVEDLVLTLDGLSVKDQLYTWSKARTLALKKGCRSLGYPTLSIVDQGEASRQLADAASLICKYGNIVAADTVEPAVYLTLLTVVANIYTDPQKPIQVEPKLYEIGEPDETSPVLFTTNFSLTYYTVESDVEASRIPAYVLVVDTEGTSVLTAYSGDKLNEESVKAAIDKFEVESKVKHRKMIIPGYVAVMSGKLEEATGWEVMVGPRESSMLPKYLQEVWS